MSDREQLVQKAKFRSWYEKNGEDRNARRRKQYREDPELRKKARENSRRQRKKQTLHGTKEKSVIRFVDGQPVTVYRMSAAAKQVNRSPETIRRWARYGWIPEAKDGGHRVFTERQVMLIGQLAEAVDEYRYASDYHDQVGSVAALIHVHWND